MRMGNLYNERLPLDNIGYINGKFIIKNGRIYLFEWIEYIIEIKGNINNVEIFFGDEKAQKIASNFFKFTYKNYIGKSTIKIYRNHELILEKLIEVVSEKFAEMYGNSEDIETIINSYETFVSSIISEIYKKIS